MLIIFNFSKFSITNYYTFLRIQLKTLGFCDENSIIFVTKSIIL